MNLNHLFNEEKVRLDPKCWTGKKIGNPKTKVKGGVRVNNCVPAESVEESTDWMQDVKALAHKIAPQDKLQQAHAERQAQEREQRQARIEQDRARLPELEAELQAMQAQYKKLGGSGYQYADREQNLSDQEREARGMEHALRNLQARIHAAKQQGVAEGAGDIGSKIADLCQKIYDLGDDAFDHVYHNAPTFAKAWDKYEGDLDSIIQEVSPKALQRIYNELVPLAQEEGILEQGVAEDISRRGFLKGAGAAAAAGAVGAAGYGVYKLDQWNQEQEQKFLSLVKDPDDREKYIQLRKDANMALALSGGKDTYWKNIAFARAASVDEFKYKLAKKYNIDLNWIGNVKEGVAEGWKDKAAAAALVAAPIIGGVGVAQLAPPTYVDGVRYEMSYKVPDNAQQTVDDKGHKVYVWTEKSSGIKSGGQQTHRLYRPVEEVKEGEQQKGADYRDPKEVDYDDEYDAMVSRVKRLAGLGPMKTVYDPTKRVYRNMPTAQQPKR